jgi:hypothetical protein
MPVLSFQYAATVQVVVPPLATEIAVEVKLTVEPDGATPVLVAQPDKLKRSFEKLPEAEPERLRLIWLTSSVNPSTPSPSLIVKSNTLTGVPDAAVVGMLTGSAIPPAAVKVPTESPAAWAYVAVKRREQETIDSSPSRNLFTLISNHPYNELPAQCYKEGNKLFFRLNSLP